MTSSEQTNKECNRCVSSHCYGSVVCPTLLTRAVRHLTHDPLDQGVVKFRRIAPTQEKEPASVPLMSLLTSSGGMELKPQSHGAGCRLKNSAPGGRDHETVVPKRIFIRNHPVCSVQRFSNGSILSKKLIGPRPRCVRKRSVSGSGGISSGSCLFPRS